MLGNDNKWSISNLSGGGATKNQLDQTEIEKPEITLD